MLATVYEMGSTTPADVLQGTVVFHQTFGSLSARIHASKLHYTQSICGTVDT